MFNRNKVPFLNSLLEYNTIYLVKTDAPLVVSFPHFLMAAREYLDGVPGMRPIQGRHETTVHLEPVGYIFSILSFITQGMSQTCGTVATD